MNLKAENNWRQRWQTIVEQILRIQTEVALRDFLQRLSAPLAPQVVAFVNAHAMNSASASAPFYDAIHGANILLRDGSGMATLFKLLSLRPGLNLNGTDLIPRIIRQFGGRRIALFGTRQPFLDRAAQAVSTRLAPHSEVVSADGFQDIEAYVALAQQHQPDLIVLGMGMPKQETVAIALRAAMQRPCLIVCGGAIIDFVGGKVTRAPAWMRVTGIEWVFRLMQEPRRLFQRYVLGNPIFLLRAMRFANFRKNLPSGRDRLRTP